MTNSTTDNNSQNAQLLERAQKIVTSLAAAQRRSNLFTLALGIVALAGISFYYYYAYQKLSEYLEPQTVVDIAQNLLEDRWPDAQQTIEDRIRTSAPEWAAQLSQQTLEAIPKARLSLQDFALDQTDERAVEVISLSEERFREILQNQRPMFQETFQALANNPDEAEKHLEDLRQYFEQQVDADFKQQMQNVLQTLEDMNLKLAKLKNGEQLSDEQKRERRILMLTRRLQTEHLPIIETIGGQ